MESIVLARHGLIYSVASILAQAITLLMVPIFTRNMSQEQFGQYNLLISVQSFLAIFITLGIYSGMTRFINEFEDKNRTKNIVLTFSGAWGLLVCLLSFFFGRYIYEIIFPGENGGYFINFLVVSSVLLCLISIYSSYYTMLFKPKIVCIINLTRAVFMLLFSVCFIMIRKEGLYGALQAQLFAYATVLGGLLIYDFKNIRPVLVMRELKVILTYGMGLVPGNASEWIYTLIDRYFIKTILGLQQVAVYSMGYRIGMIMDPILITPFKSVFTSFKYKFYKEDDAPKRFKEIYGYYNIFGWFCVLGFSVFAKPAIVILSTSEYNEAFKFVPLIVFSYFLYGLGEFYSLGIHIRKKSILASFILGLGALSNILCNIALIPVFGIMGAAIATILSYLLMNMLNFLIGKRYLNLGLNYLEPVKGGLIALGLYGVYLAIHNIIMNLFLEICFSSLLCLLFIVISIFSGLMPQETVKLVLTRFKQKFV